MFGFDDLDAETLAVMQRIVVVMIGLSVALPLLIGL